MKIMEIISDLQKRAGAEVFFDSLCREILKDDNVELIVVVIWDLIDDTFADLINNPKIKFYCCGKKKKGIDLKSIKAFKKILKNENPDIIHTHRSVLLTYFLSFGLKKQKWEYFHTVHNIANQEAGKYEITLRKKYVKKGIIKQIGISDKISETIYDVYGEYPVATIYNGIKLSTNKHSAKKYDFICVARFSKQKNHAFLLSSFNEFVKKKPETKLLLVGDGELLDGCKEYVINSHLEDNVIFYGICNDVISLMRESQMFVLGSLYEGNPITILEAMSVGLPIIAPNVGGIPDVVVDKKNGFLYEVNDSDGLIKCLDKITLDKTQLDEMSKQNMQKSQQFSIETCSKKYLNLFENK